MVGLDQGPITVDSQDVGTMGDMDQDLVDVDHLAVELLVTVDPWLSYWALVEGLGQGSQRTTVTGEDTKDD